MFPIERFSVKVVASTILYIIILFQGMNMLPPEFMRLISRYTSFAEIHRIQMLVGHFTLAEALIMSTKEVIFIPIKSTSGCVALIFEDASQNQPGNRVASLWKRVIQSNLTEEQTITASDTEPEPTVGLGPSS